ncbi:hypothetical protein GE061_012058 [Apolygus lucorum]|uniref:Transmembrane protein 50A n=1 Tax=Apolygus lucorum TaxID=248454 RepID=A0A6A4JK79_APOLU|nr:hypothetical protein GE061_012058 [Apolygus lucorum]
MPPCIWFEGGDKRNALASLLSGTLFFTGIWLAIDANSTHPDAFKGPYHLCGIVGTLSLIMINLVSNNQLQGDSYSGGFLGPRGARLWLFVGFVLGFASVIASCWLLFSQFVGNDEEKDNMWFATKIGHRRK